MTKSRSQSNPLIFDPAEANVSPPGTANGPILRAMTYNIHHGVGMDRRYDLNRIAEVIRNNNPDVVALQEVERFRPRTKNDNQPSVLAKKLGMHYSFAPVCNFSNIDKSSRSRYGIAILSRYPITSREHFDISFGSANEPRGVLHARLNVNGIGLHVFCVHLGLRYRERNYQIERLLSEEIINHARYNGGPKILLGDFNNWWPVKSARYVHTHFHNACVVTGQKRLRTFGKFFNYLCLDYIFTSRDVSIRSCDVIRDGEASRASDHRPVVCTLQLPDKKAATGAEKSQSISSQVSA
jgi:endonuclease/exonuclease/phosphatase family metal-dependent hydrolase